MFYQSLIAWVCLGFILVAGDQSTGSIETEEEELVWWKKSVIYEIWPLSFSDSDRDGKGDLFGVLSKVNYLKELGIGAVWFSPFFVSPLADHGYDVANYTDIDPVYGGLGTFDVVLEALQSQEIRVILDFVPNHSSDEHPWFIKSVKRIDPYTDYYVWKEPKGFDEDGNPIPPNNWNSVFGNSAWEWNEERKQFYLHQFLVKQPDLNVRNPAVLEELDNVIRFWFQRKVDGLRVDALKFLFEVDGYNLNEPIDTNSGIEDENEYYYLLHPHTTNQPESVDAMRRWKAIADEYQDRILIPEVYDDDIQHVIKYYGTEEDSISQFPFNFNLITELENRSSITGENLKRSLDIWLENIPDGKWPNWVLGNHDRSRVATRLGKDLIDAMNALILLLPGTPTTYYGEEIGMEDTFVSFEETKDNFGLNFGPDRYQEFSRDFFRTPMQWDSSTNAGFSTASSTWLPINDNYETLNVENQTMSTPSHLKVYQSLTTLREEKTFTHGDMHYAAYTRDLFAFVRNHTDETDYLVAINTSIDDKVFDLTSELSYPISTEGTIVIRSSSDERPETDVGSTISLSEASLLGGEVLVIKLQQIS